MIPTTGWLPDVLRTFQSPEPSPLPVPHQMNYGDGAQGSYAPHDVVPIDLVVLTEGNVNFGMEYGFTLADGEYGFLVNFQQNEVHGVTLLDYLDPPEVDPFDEEEDTDVITDKELCPTNENVQTVEACCSLFSDWYFNGDVLFNGTRTFGAFP